MTIYRKIDAGIPSGIGGDRFTETISEVERF